MKSDGLFVSSGQSIQIHHDMNLNRKRDFNQSQTVFVAGWLLGIKTQKETL